MKKIAYLGKRYSRRDFEAALRDIRPTGNMEALTVECVKMTAIVKKLID